MPLRPDAVSSRTRYLLDLAGLRPDSMSAPELVARGAAPLITLLRRWWTDLEPEVTAGVTDARMDDALAAYAAEAVKKPEGTFSRRWARAWFNWKPGLLQSDAEQVIAERFLAAMDRLGVLTPLGKSHLCFASPTLLELYLGLHYQKKKELPLESPSPLSLAPVQSVQGRAAIALLALTPADERKAMLVAVARRNLHLAVWFLYANDEARAEHGEWLAARLLESVQWSQPDAERSSAESALESLGVHALVASRDLLRKREAALPACLAAIAYLQRHGGPEDVATLRELANDPALGQWEIDRLRSKLREAEALVVDPAAQQRYKRHEIGEMAKDTVVMIVAITGAIASRTTQPYPWGSNTVVSVAGGLAETGAPELLHVSTTFFHAQRTLRELLASLPATIERRKVEIAELAPRVRAACNGAVAALEAR